MAANPLTEEYTCAFCLQKFLYMNDPRELPCTHVFCLPCLEADVEEMQGMKCNICSQVYEVYELSSLPTPESSCVEPKTVSVATHVCDVCTDFPAIAVSYCHDCDKILCEEHTEVHDQSKPALRLLSNKNHDSMPITDMKPTMRVQQVFCTDHVEEVLTLACGFCHRMFCSLCKTEAPCINTEGLSASHHAIAKLDRLAQELRDELKGSMKTLADKITHVCKLEKMGWRMLDEVEAKTKDMSQEIDRVAEEQISEIRRHAITEKDQLKSNLSTSTNHVEDYTTQLVLVKERMQELWRVLHTHAKGSDVQLLNSQKDNRLLVEDMVNSKVPALPAQLSPLPGSVYKLRNLTTSISDPPTSLQLRKALNYGSCYAINWNSQDNLLAGVESSFIVFDKILNNLKAVAIKNCLISVCEAVAGTTQKLHYFAWTYEYVYSHVSHVSDKVITQCNQYSSELKLEQKLDSFSTTATSRELDPFIRRLEVNSSKSHVLVLSSNRLDVISMRGNWLYSISLENMAGPRGIHSLSDGSVLVASSSHVYKYRYQAPPLPTELVWKSKAINNIHGLSSDASGCIYAGCADGVQLLSPKGELLRLLFHQKLRSAVIADVRISKSGEQIAVACGTGGLILFDISRETLI